MEVKVLKVKEIIDLIDRGELNTEQSVQRRFVYKSVIVDTDQFGKMSKADKLVTDILSHKVQYLAPVYFFKNTDTGNLNIHDGKQRILTLYNYIKGNNNISYHKIIDGQHKEYQFIQLRPSTQENLLNFELGIQITEGNSAQEEQSFFETNTNSLPLTTYEALRGTFYGTYLDEFEEYIDTKSRSGDRINLIGRGEQAINFLYILLNPYTDDSNLSKDIKRDKLSEYLKARRHSHFIEKEYLDKILNTYIELSKLINKNLNVETALRVAKYISDKNLSCAAYKVVKVVNDIESWKFSTHKVYLNSYAKGLKLDPLDILMKT